ncbi:MAG: transcriptional repressor [Spirochaetes bacterium]|nr:transcriptional repressor [Spirochaetota bacterium]
MNKCCDAKTLLKQNNLKITKRRILLLEKIIDSGKCFSAISLQEKVENNMDLATIYRILTLFLKNKIIREILSNDTTRFYELSCVHNPVHPHFFCRKCSRTIHLNAVEDDYISQIEKMAGDNIVEDINIHLAGICSQCK